MRKSVILALAACLPLALTSCGGPTGLHPVMGQVTYKGAPAEGATVFFQREDGEPTPPNQASVVATGTVDGTGHYYLDSGDLGDGAAPGKYKVLIQWRTRAEGTAAPQAAAKKKGRRNIVNDKPDGTPDRLEGRYMKADAPKLHAEVKPGKNDIPAFDISD